MEIINCTILLKEPDTNHMATTLLIVPAKYLIKSGSYPDPSAYKPTLYLLKLLVFASCYLLFPFSP